MINVTQLKNLTLKNLFPAKDVLNHYSYLRSLYTKARQKRRAGNQRLTELQRQILAEMDFLDEFIEDKEEEHQQQENLGYVENNNLDLATGHNPKASSMASMDQESIDDGDVIFIDEIAAIGEEENIQVCDEQNNVWTTWSLTENKDEILLAMKKELEENTLFVKSNICPEPSLATIASDLEAEKPAKVTNVLEAGKPAMVSNVFEDGLPATITNNFKPATVASALTTAKSAMVTNYGEAPKPAMTTDVMKAQIFKEAALKARIIGNMLEKCSSEKYCNVMVAMMDIFGQYGV